MAISTFAELKTAVANWLHRDDLTAIIPDFIVLAESQIRQDVRVRAMEQTASGSLSAATLALPTRFAEARRVILGTTPQAFLTPEAFYPYRDSVTNHYTILGTNFVFQQTSGTYQVDYWQWFAPFSDDADTNWLLTNHPDVYLSAAMFEAATYVEGNPLPWAARYQAALQKLRRAEAKMTGPLRVQVALSSVI